MLQLAPLGQLPFCRHSQTRNSSRTCQLQGNQQRVSYKVINNGMLTLAVHQEEEGLQGVFKRLMAVHNWRLQLPQQHNICLQDNLCWPHSRHAAALLHHQCQLPCPSDLSARSPNNQQHADSHNALGLVESTYHSGSRTWSTAGHMSAE
jgi:hypothetical protein